MGESPPPVPPVDVQRFRGRTRQHKAAKKKKQRSGKRDQLLSQRRLIKDLMMATKTEQENKNHKIMLKIVINKKKGRNPLMSIKIKNDLFVATTLKSLSYCVIIKVL